MLADLLADKSCDRIVLSRLIKFVVDCKGVSDKNEALNMNDDGLYIALVNFSSAKSNCPAYCE